MSFGVEEALFSPSKARPPLIEPSPMTAMMCLFFILIGRSHRHAQSGGDGIGSMSAGERVVFAFGRRGERFQPVQLPVGRETFPAFCQYLMAVCLMSDIPYDAVVRRVVHIMQSDRQLHDA